MSESEQESPQSTRSATLYPIDKTAGAAYFVAAQKRLGFLKPSLMYIQCLFLFGVFQMYLLKAMQAWSYFSQACVQFRNLLYLRARRPTSPTDSIRTTRRLEQRLYWSCLKSEL